MHAFEDFLHKLAVHAAKRALSAALVENLTIPYGLQHGHVVLLLVLSDFAAYAHTLGKQVHQLVVEFVNLLTQFVDTLSGDFLVADDEEREDVVEHIGSDLLLGVAPCGIGVAVGFHEQTVEAEVHRLLAEGGDELAPSTDVAGVADDGQRRDAAAQFDRYLPHGEIAVDFLVIAGETAVDGCQTGDTSLVDALEGTNP